MKTANKLTITLSPEEVQTAVLRFVMEFRMDELPSNVTFRTTFSYTEYSGELTGATVEVTQP